MAQGGWAQPVVIDVGGVQSKKALIGAVVAAIVGLVALIAGIAGLGDRGGVGGGIVAMVIGLVFLLIGLLPVMMWRKISRPRHLVFEPQGVRWDDPQGAPWAVPWSDLGAVSISRTVERRYQAQDYLVPRTIMVRLDLFPRDPAGFRARHPEMEHLWEFHKVKNGYRLPLAANPKFIPLIEHGMRQFQPGIYRGVVDEGFMVGLH